MKALTLTAVVASLLIFTACGSNEQDTGTVKDQPMEMQKQQNTMHSDQSDDVASDPEWERVPPVDVEAIDRDGDGFVYQDHMDWNVLADEPGKCPVCGMKLVKTSVSEAKANLREHGFDIK
jgi:Cu(I)/Ag(I) efflux system membrane fusion protein/cobalt-zinc-cadmium efflux system membrane fusion protein